MTDEQRIRLVVIVAVAINVMVQAGIVTALAMSWEWRVWRFMINAVAQLDALLILAWLCCGAISSRPLWRIARARVGIRMSGQCDEARV